MDYTEGPFSCPKCSASYKFKTSWYNHMKLHSGETYCQLCKKAHATVYSYRRHMIMVHGETWDFFEKANPELSLYSDENDTHEIIFVILYDSAFYLSFVLISLPAPTQQRCNHRCWTVICIIPILNFQFFSTLNFLVYLRK